MFTDIDKAYILKSLLDNINSFIVYLFVVKKKAKSVFFNKNNCTGLNQI